MTDIDSINFDEVVQKIKHTKDAEIFQAIDKQMADLGVNGIYSFLNGIWNANHDEDTMHIWEHADTELRILDQAHDACRSDYYW